MVTINNRQAKKRQTSFLKGVFLALLLVFVPCKVRNFIERSLDIEVSKSNVQIKTTCKKECNLQFYSKQQVQKNAPIADGGIFLQVVPSGFNAIKNWSNKVILQTRQKTRTSIPFYVLFQQLKIHLV